MTVTDFHAGYDTPYYSGAGVESSTGVSYPVSLGGVNYALDTLDYEFSHTSVPLMRAAIDDKQNVGSQTLNPESFWRRTFESWHVGAGQTHFDRRDESIPWRFRRSKGINVWDRYQVSLLNDTDQKRVSANTNLFLAVAGTHLYITDGTELRYTTDITPGSPTFTNVTGVPGAAPVSLASDGFSVLTAHSASGIYKTTRGAATTASHITGTVAHVAYGKGRWIATSGPNLYDVTTQVAGAGPVALPAALYTQPNSDFAFNSFAEGPSAFYAGGFSGDKSLIYRLTMKEDGTGLNQPVVAGFLPDGELIQSMQGYLGFVLIGTSKGVRVGIVGGNGDLTIGALIDHTSPVLCFEGQEKFVWYGLTNYESGNSGLGRINLETFSDTDALAPAYASDLIVSSGSVTGNTVAVVTFQGRRVFTVAASGIWAEEVGTLVASGQIDSGLFDYGLTDEKLSLYVDMSHVSHDGGSHEVWLSQDRGVFALLATHTDEHDPIATGEARAHEFEVRVVLNRASGDPAMGPVIRSWGLRSQPATRVTEQIVVPLLIGPQITRVDGFVDPVDSFEKAQHIATLCRSKEVVLYQEGSRGWSVIVTDYQLDVKEVSVAHDSGMGINATCLTKLTVVT